MAGVVNVDCPADSAAPIMMAPDSSGAFKTSRSVCADLAARATLMSSISASASPVCVPRSKTPTGNARSSSRATPIAMSMPSSEMDQLVGAAARPRGLNRQLLVVKSVRRVALSATADVPAVFSSVVNPAALL